VNTFDAPDACGFDLIRIHEHEFHSRRLWPATITRASGQENNGMPFRIESRHLQDVLVIAPTIFKDERGFFIESFRADSFQELGIHEQFLQDNHSGSKRGVIRGLHFQFDPPMCKLMRVTAGNAFLVAVDIRVGSPTLGQWFGMEVSADSGKMIYAPAGFARGFCALSEWVEVQYKCTAVYNPKTESGIRWNDPRIDIKWPVTQPLLSKKDAEAQTLDQWLSSPNAQSFAYQAAGP
jgi:dTDP-4-dehydrorhamnose 3,5-epimerase